MKFENVFRIFQKGTKTLKKILSFFVGCSRAINVAPVMRPPEFDSMDLHGFCQLTFKSGIQSRDSVTPNK